VGGTLNVSGAITAPQFIISASGGYFYSDASVTQIQWDTGGWVLQYLRSNGTLRYLRGGDSVNMWQVDGNGNTSQPGSASVGGRATVNEIMCVSGIFRVANNDNYYLARNGNDGNWNFVENGTVTFTIAPGGSAYAPNIVQAANGVYARGGNSGIFAGGNGVVFQFSPSWYIDWNINTGTYTFMHPSYGAGTWIVYSDGRVFNNVSNVGGHGAYVDYSDERAKQDISPACEGLDAILAIRPIRFKRIGKQFDRVEIGFSAQQLRDVIPEAVTEYPFSPPDGVDEPVLGMMTTPIVAALVNAMKTLNARIETLENRSIH
jgi:hypothetical protein